MSADEVDVTVLQVYVYYISCQITFNVNVTREIDLDKVKGKKKERKVECVFVQIMAYLIRLNIFYKSHCNKGPAIEQRHRLYLKVKTDFCK